MVCFKSCTQLGNPKIRITSPCQMTMWPWFVWCRSWCTLPLLCLFFSFWLKAVNPTPLHSDESCEKIILICHKQCQTVLWHHMSHALLLKSQKMWHPWSRYIWTAQLLRQNIIYPTALLPDELLIGDLAWSYPLLVQYFLDGDGWLSPWSGLIFISLCRIWACT